MDNKCPKCSLELVEGKCPVCDIVVEPVVEQVPVTEQTPVADQPAA